MSSRPASITPSHPAGDVAICDPVWDQIREEAKAAVADEPALAGFVYANILSHDRLEHAVAHRLAQRLDHRDLGAGPIFSTFTDLIRSEPELADAFRADLIAFYDRDPACKRLLEPLLYFKGFHAIETHRFTHVLYKQGRRDFALYLQSQVARDYAVDINPAARIGRGIFIDHAHGIVVGETAVIGNEVSILHGVTLGGTGKEDGDRHPKIGDCVLIGAGAKILGNITVGHCSRIASGSVVLKDVPPNSTVAGVPAKIVGEAGCPEPSRTMDQMLVRD